MPYSPTALRTDRVRSSSPTARHEQYTRNMATGASNADLAILLVDARKGLLTQTRRHATIVSLLGSGVVLAVNKMDWWASMPSFSGIVRVRSSLPHWASDRQPSRLGTFR